MIGKAARVAAVCVACVALSAAGETRRLAIVVGNNAGTGSMPPLRYAENDAGKMARVLEELGDVAAQDVLLLLGRSVADVEQAIAESQRRVRDAKRSPDTRTVVLFYFSGHSDGEALELSGQRLPYARVRALLAGTQADVRLVIVDACRSGGGIAQKGGAKAEAFTIKLADTLNATGEAFITSSAADEASLESSEVMGSYFTHNFISGLRGAADTSLDKLVTLQEAYQYAYNRTVSATSVLGAGSQHPTYDFKLSGQGELVLSSLLRPSAVLVVPAAERVLVADLRRDQVLVELPQGPSRELALAPGQYGVRVFKDGQGFGARVTISANERRVLSWSELSPTTTSLLVASKGGAPAEVAQPLPRPVPAERARVPVGVGFGLGFSRVILDDALRAQAGPLYQLRFFVDPARHTISEGAVGRLVGQLAVSLLGELSLDPVRPGRTEPVNEAGVHARVGYRLAFESGRFFAGLGLGVSVGGLFQLFRGGQASVVPGFGPAATVRVAVVDGLLLFVDGELTVLFVTGVAAGGGVQLIPWGIPSVSAGLALAL